MTSVEPGPMPNPRQSAVRPDQIRQRQVERENCGGGPLVAEHLLLRRLRQRQIAQISADNRIDVCADGAGHDREWFARPVFEVEDPFRAALARATIGSSSSSPGCAASAAL